MKHRIELDLKFPAKGFMKIFGRLQKKKVGFRFTHFALFTALDVFECEPSDFEKKSEMDQLFAIAYGAAVHDAIKTGEPVFFSFDDIKKAFMMGSVEQAEALGKAWANASYPQCIKDSIFNEEEGHLKKKSQSKTLQRSH